MQNAFSLYDLGLKRPMQTIKPFPKTKGKRMFSWRLEDSQNFSVFHFSSSKPLSSIKISNLKLLFNACIFSEISHLIQMGWYELIWAIFLDNQYSPVGRHITSFRAASEHFTSATRRHSIVVSKFWILRHMIGCTIFTRAKVKALQSLFSSFRLIGQIWVFCDLRNGQIR